MRAAEGAGLVAEDIGEGCCGCLEDEDETMEAIMLIGDWDWWDFEWVRAYSVLRQGLLVCWESDTLGACI